MKTRTIYQILPVIVVMLAWCVPSAHARVYDPTTGRWLERDPIGYVDGMNMYQYVDSNPVRYLDPSGQRLVIDGDSGFRSKVVRALQRMCLEAKLKSGEVWIDKPAGGYEPTIQDRRRVHDAERQAEQDGTSCDVKPDPECRKRPGCDILDCLINDKATHRIRQAGRGETDRNVETGGGNTDTSWTGRSRDRKFGRDFLGLEVLYHELVHACHTAKGTRDRTETAPGETGWEEVNTIEEMNKLREWYNKCGKRERNDPDLDPRDPFSHPWSKDLKDKQRPGGGP